MEAENIKIKPAPKDRKLSPSPFGNRLESAKFAVIRIDRLLVARLLTKHRHITHPMKEDVKEKILLPPSAEAWVWRLTSSPVSFLEGVLVLPLWFAAYGSGDASPSC